MCLLASESLKPSGQDSQLSRHIIQVAATGMFDAASKPGVQPVRRRLSTHRRWVKAWIECEWLLHKGIRPCGMRRDEDQVPAMSRHNAGQQNERMRRQQGIAPDLLARA